jgi:hypothetical protein
LARGHDPQLAVGLPHYSEHLAGRQGFAAADARPCRSYASAS